MSKYSPLIVNKINHWPNGVFYHDARVFENCVRINRQYLHLGSNKCVKLANCALYRQLMSQNAADMKCGLLEFTGPAVVLLSIPPEATVLGFRDGIFFSHLEVVRVLNDGEVLELVKEVSLAKPDISERLEFLKTVYDRSYWTDFNGIRTSLRKHLPMNFEFPNVVTFYNNEFVINNFLFDKGAVTKLLVFSERLVDWKGWNLNSPVETYLGKDQIKQKFRILRRFAQYSYDREVLQRFNGLIQLDDEVMDIDDAIENHLYGLEPSNLKSASQRLSTFS